MKVHLRIMSALLSEMQTHLRLAHPIAHERVGFLACRGGRTATGIALLPYCFLPVADGDYERDPTVGARISSEAIRKTMQYAYNHQADSILFVHEHVGRGKPSPSRTDTDCWNDLIPAFWNATRHLPHGGLILSEDSAFGLVWVRKGEPPALLTDVSAVGATIRRLLTGGRA